MYKESAICIIIISIIVIANIITQNYTNDSVEFMDNNLQILKEELTKDNVNKEKVQEKMEKVSNGWKEKYEILAYFIEHDELEKVETELTSLKAHIDVEEYEDGVSELEKSIFILNHINDKFKVNVKNIF